MHTYFQLELLLLLIVIARSFLFVSLCKQWGQVIFRGNGGGHVVHRRTLFVVFFVCKMTVMTERLVGR